MTIYAVLIIFMVIAIIADIIGILTFFHKKMLTKVKASSDLVHLECEKCNTRFEEPLIEFCKRYFTRSISTSKTKMIKKPYPAIVSITNVKRMSKRFYCKSCGKKRWCRVLNLDEIQEKWGMEQIKNGICILVCWGISGFILTLFFELLNKITKWLF